jgi:hypothetical protein
MWIAHTAAHTAAHKRRRRRLLQPPSVFRCQTAPTAAATFPAEFRNEVKAMGPLPALTAETKRRVLEKLERCGFIVTACAGIVTDRTFYLWRRADPDFAAAAEAAVARYVESLEQEADRRAVEGVPRGIYYKGQLVATEREYSDSLLMFRLKALAPERYRERQEVTGPNGGPQEVVIKVIYGDNRGYGPSEGAAPKAD